MQKTFIALAALVALNLPNNTLANTCGLWQSKLNSTQRKLNNGGNQSQVKQWAKERNYYANELDKCNKKSGTHRWIETSGSNSRQVPQRRTHEQPRTINTDNAQLQQIIATCNYWIGQYNQKATDDNRTFKNTACLNADKSAQDLKTIEANANALNTTTRTMEESFPKRSLKECVKPNNRIDDDVKRCMQGQIEPNWPLNY
jgi:hypothetical protein